jgi:acetyltransferase-like isoleucine patch superfamily enzyme
MTWTSHGSGRFTVGDLGAIGERCVIEDGVMAFNPSHIFLGDDVYIGHRAMLKADTRGDLRIESGAWIGQDAYMHSAGGIRIGARTGVGPRVIVLTSTHEETAPPQAIVDGPLTFAPVDVGEGCDIGVGAILLPGARVGDGSQIGAGAVVTTNVPAGSVAAGVPARVLRRRGERR